MRPLVGLRGIMDGSGQIAIHSPLPFMAFLYVCSPEVNGKHHEELCMSHHMLLSAP